MPHSWLLSSCLSGQNTRQLLGSESTGRWRHTPPLRADGRAGGRSGLLCGRCYTLARGAQTVCLSVRGREVNCSAGDAGAAVAAARPSVLELEEGGRKGGARALSPSCRLAPSQNLCECVASASVAVGLPLLLPASPNLRRGWICISLSSNFQRPSTLTGLMLSHRRQY